MLAVYEQIDSYQRAGGLFPSGKKKQRVRLNPKVLTEGLAGSLTAGDAKVDLGDSLDILQPVAVVQRLRRFFDDTNYDLAAASNSNKHL